MFSQHWGFSMLQYLDNLGRSCSVQGKNVTWGACTENMQEGPGSDGGDAAAAE